MARGMSCPQCKTTMFALRETDEPKGSYVTYQCRNSACRFELKKFEDK